MRTTFVRNCEADRNGTHDRPIKKPTFRATPSDCLEYPALLLTFPSTSTDVKSPFYFPDRPLCIGRVSRSGVIARSRINIGGFHCQLFWSLVLFFPPILLSIIPITLAVRTQPDGGMLLPSRVMCLDPSWRSSRHISPAVKSNWSRSQSRYPINISYLSPLLAIPTTPSLSTALFPFLPLFCEALSALTTVF